MSIRVRRLAANEVPYGQRCVNELWRENHILSRDAALFSWFYRPAEPGGPLGFFVAEDGDEPVGCMGRIELPCHVHGLPVPGAAIALLVVRPEYRASGLGLQLMREVYAGRQLVVTLGINDHVARLYRMLGQHIVNPVPRYVCVGNRDALAALWAASDHNERVAPDDYARCSVLERGLPPPKGVTVRPLTAADLDAWDTAWAARFAPGLQGAVRDAAFLRWRYLEHPNFHYEILAAFSPEGRVDGLAVARRIPLPVGTAALRILDFLAAPGPAEDGLVHALAALAGDDVAFVEYVCLGQTWLPLEKLGLSPRGSELFSVYFSPPDYAHCAVMGSLLVRIPGCSPAGFAQDPHTYITIADSDQDRKN